MNRRAVLLGLASTAMTPIPIIRSIPEVSTSTTAFSADAIEQVRNALLAFDIRPTEITMSDKVAAYFERVALASIRADTIQADSPP